MKNLEKVRVSVLWNWQPSSAVVQPSHKCFIPFSDIFLSLLFPLSSLFLWPSSLLNLYFLLKSKCILPVYNSGCRTGMANQHTDQKRVSPANKD